MNLPSKEQCLKLLDTYHVPQNIRRHVIKVTKIALGLGYEFKKQGIKINLDLIERASLLHDLFRMADIHGDCRQNKFIVPSDQTEANYLFWESLKEKYPKTHHGVIAADYFKADYPELAQVIREHMFDVVLEGKFTSWEAKIVSYADKRVDHDRIVTLAERKAQGEKRWNTKLIKDLDQTYIKLAELETEIFSVIKQSPDIIK